VCPRKTFDAGHGLPLRWPAGGPHGGGPRMGRASNRIFGERFTGANLPVLPQRTVTGLPVVPLFTSFDSRTTVPESTIAPM
jgi:hypothetical protein